MITLVVAAILFGVAIPNLRVFIQNSRMTTQSNEVVGEFALARSEAIKRNKTVVVCRSANPTAATPVCGGAGGWETGWITFMDNAPEDSLYSSASNDELIRQHGPLSSGTTVVASDATLANVIVFAGSGLATTLSTKPFFQVCDGRGTSYARAIVFETTGRAHIAQQSGLPGGFACP
jgi:type IV fimbrial biogenesis protein FimT